MLALLLTTLVATSDTSVLVMPIQTRPLVSADLAEQLTTALVGEAGKIRGFSVVSYKEVEGALSQEQLKQIAGCNTESCAAELAGALNTEQVVIGSLGRVGKSYLLSLTRLSARTARVIARVTERFSANDDEALLDRIPALTAELFGRAPAPEVSSSNGFSPGRWALRGLAAGGVVSVLATGLFASVLSANFFAAIAIDSLSGFSYLQRSAKPHAITATGALVADVGMLSSLLLTVSILPALAACALSLGVSFVLP